MNGPTAISFIIWLLTILFMVAVIVGVCVLVFYVVKGRKNKDVAASSVFSPQVTEHLPQPQANSAGTNVTLHYLPKYLY